MKNKKQAETAPFAFAAIGKFRDDSHTDLVLVNEDSNSVSIFFNEGTSHPTSDPGTRRTGIDTASLHLAQGKRLTMTNAGTREMESLIAKGPYRFSPTKKDIPVGTRPSYVIVGEFRKKGLFDIAVTNAGSDNVSILQNQGNGKFVNSQTIPVGKRPMGMAIGDFFGDGLVHIAVANAGSNDISLLRNDGKGGFVEVKPRICMGDKSPCSLAARKFFGSGPDLVVAYGGEDIAILKSNGGGTFATPQTISVPFRSGPFPIRFVAGFNGRGGRPLAVISGDFNQKGNFHAVSVPLRVLLPAAKKLPIPKKPPSPGCGPGGCGCTQIC